MTNIISTWFYAEQQGNESEYPSVGSNTSDLSFQVIYWKCVVDFFESVRLTQDHPVECYFFTNTDQYPSKEDMNGLDLYQYFDKNKIHVVKQELTRVTPKDWYGSWRNQFYVFDILKYFSTFDNANIMILDSDCLIRKDLTEVFNSIQENGAIEYDLGNDDTVQENGVSHLEMTEIYESFYGEKPDSIIRYKGGEFIGVTSKVAKLITVEFENLWPMNYKRYENSQNKLNEEAHCLSVLYERLGLVNSVANQYISRMWTALKYDTVKAGDEKLPIWHLPSEKKYGLEKLYDFLNSHNENKENYLRYSEKIIGVPGNKWFRKLKRFSRRIFVGK